MAAILLTAFIFMKENLSILIKILLNFVNKTYIFVIELW